LFTKDKYYKIKRKVYSLKKVNSVFFSKEDLLSLNGEIESCFNQNFNKKSVRIQKESFFSFSAISYFVIKQRVLSAFGYKKQYLYLI
jgi:hypothetical protein